MATQIGTLLIEMSANVARLQQDMDQAKSVVNSAMDQVKGAVDGAQKAMVGLAGGMAAAFTVNAFRSGIESAIHGMAELEKAAQRAGVSVESLSGLKSIAKLSGTGLDEAAAGLQKLSKAMDEAADGAKKQKAIFDGLGISVTDNNGRLRDSSEVMLELAEKLDGVESGTQKVAIAQQVMGKAGANLLPLLHDMAEVGELVGKTTKEQATMAREYEIQLMKLEARKKALYMTIAKDVLPVYVDFNDMLLKSGNAMTKANDAAKGLSEQNYIKEWARAAASAVALVMDAFDGVGRIVMSVTKGMAALVAQMVAVSKGDFAGASAIGAAYEEDRSGIWKGYTALKNYTLLREQFDKRDAGQKDSKSSGGTSRPDTRADSSTKDKITEYDRLVKSINEKIAADQAELASTEKLTEGDKIAIKVKTDIRDGTLKLTDAQKQNVAGLLERLVIESKAVEYKKELAKWSDELSKKLDSETKSISDQAKHLRDQIDAMGLTKAQQDDLTASKLLMQAATKDATAAQLDEAAAILEVQNVLPQVSEAYRKESAVIAEQAKALRELAALRREASAKEVAVEEAKKVADEWKKVADDLGRGLTDSLYRSFESGKDFGKTFFEGLQNLAKATVIKIPLQFIQNGVSNAIGQAFGAAGSAVASGGGLFGLGGTSAGSANGVGSALSIGSNGYNLMNGGGGLYNSFATSSMGQTLGLSAPTAVLDEAALFESLANGATTAEATTAATIVGEAGELGLTASGSALGMAIPAIGIALALASAFSKKKKKEPEIPASIYDTTFGMDGENAPFLIANGSKNFTDFAGANSASAGYLLETKKILKTLGINPLFSEKFVNHTGDSGSYGFAMSVPGYSFAESGVADKSNPKVAAQAIDEAFTRAVIGLMGSDAVTAEKKKLWGELTQLGMGARDAFDAMDAFQKFKDSLKLINKGAGDAAGELAKLAGGLDVLTAQTNDYYANYFSADEQHAKAMKDLSALFEEAGLVMPKTRGEFRQIVEALDLTTTAGKETFTAMMKLEGAFASLVDASVKATNKATKEQIMATADAALSMLDKAVTAEKARLKAVYDANIVDVGRHVTDMQAVRDEIGSLADALKAAIGTINADTSAILLSARQAAQGVLNNALGVAQGGGSISPLADAITGAIGTLQKPSENLYASFEDYARAQGQANGAIVELSKNASAQKSVADMQLLALQGVKDSLDAQYQQDLAALDATLKSAKDQIDALKGIDNSVLSVREAVNAVTAAIASIKLGANTTSNIGAGQVAAITAGTNSISGTSNTSIMGQVEAMYEQVAGRQADAGGLLYWASQAQTAGGISNILGDFREQLIINGEVPRFAAGGNHRGGLRLVGENGPELEVTGPSRIYSTSETASMMAGGGAATADEVRALREDQRAQSAAMAGFMARFTKIIERWEGNGMPETRTVV